MARPQLAAEKEIEKALKDIPLWKREGKLIIREFSCENFAAAAGAVTAIAILAEKMDHHPDLSIFGYNKLRVSLSTHDQGGLTELDFNLAKKIDKLNY